MTIISNLGTFNSLSQEMIEEVSGYLKANQIASLRVLSQAFNSIITIEFIVKQGLYQGFRPQLDRLYQKDCERQFARSVVSVIFSKGSLEQQECLLEGTKSFDHRYEVAEDLPTGLKSLCLSYVGSKLVLYPPEMTQLNGLTCLEELKLRVVFASTEELAGLSNLTTLTSLHLQSVHEFKDESFALLAPLTRLQSLTVTNCTNPDLSYSGLSHLVHLSHLTQLHCLEIIDRGNTSVPSCVEAFTALKSFQFSNISISDKHLEQIRQMTNLII